MRAASAALSLGRDVPKVELPCGCVLTETQVVAMCIQHDQDLKTAAAVQRKSDAVLHEEFRRTIVELSK